MFNRPWQKIVAHGLLFQAVWFACVLAPWPWAAFATGAFLVTSVIWLLTPGNLLNIVRIAVLGCAMDSVLVYTGVFEVASEQKVIPLWLVFLWLAFATAPFGFLRFLHRRYWMAAVAGALGGPAAYFSGAALNADIALAAPVWQSLLILGIAWAVFLPLVFAYSDRRGVLQAKQQTGGR